MRFFQRLAGLKMEVRSSDIQVELGVQLLLHGTKIITMMMHYKDFERRALK